MTDIDKPKLPQVSGYSTEAVLGKGGMATVYLAVQQSLSRHVALKVMNQFLVMDDDFRQRFLNEGRMIAKLSHRNIVTIYDIGVSDGIHYFSMTYLPGGTLHDKIREGLSLDQALDILKSISSALGYAHRLGIVHRDIKPGNILFANNGTPVLTDFGIAKIVGSETQLTSTGMTVGSAKYMSPEQALGQAVDNRSDLYSLGVLLWLMLTGDFPYHADDPFALALKHAKDPIPQLPERLHHFQPMIDGLLAKQPGDRIATAEELVRIIDEIAYDDTRARPPPPSDQTVILPRQSEPPPSHPNSESASAARPAPAPKRRFTLVAGLTGTACILGIAGYIGYSGLLAPSADTPPASVPATLPPPPKLAEGTDPTPDTIQEKPELHVVGQGDGRPDIEALLRQAEDQWQAGRITEPQGDNAFESYSRVLDLDPDHKEAQQRLVQIGSINAANKVFLFAETLLRQGKIDAARQMIETGLKMNPNDERLSGLKRVLDYEQ